MFYGKKQSELATEIRTELLKRSDIEPVAFTSSDGLNLSGFLLRRPNAIGNLVLCHGYKGTKEFMYNYLDSFSNYNILLFDFRAHGQSTGHIISLGCHEYKDVIAATRFMKQAIPDKKIPTILLGISMGGASSLRAVKEEPALADALIIDSTYSELEKMFLRAYYLRVNLPYYPFYPIIRSMFHYLGDCDIKEMSIINCVKNIKQPILFIHSCTDSFIKPSNSVTLFSYALNPKTKLWIGPKCRHGWLHTYFPKFYKAKVDRFLGKTVFPEPKSLIIAK